MGEARLVLAFALLAHGVAHGVGFAGPWGLIDGEHVTFSRGLFGGRVRVGNVVLRVLGTIWLALAVGFSAAAIAVAARRPWGIDLALLLAPASVVMCIVHWPAARLGVAANAAVLAGLGAALYLGL